MFDLPVIDIHKCTGCGICVQVCPSQCLKIVNGIATIIKPEGCLWCTECEAVCPFEAARCSFEIVIEEVAK